MGDLSQAGGGRCRADGRRAGKHPVVFWLQPGLDRVREMDGCPDRSSLRGEATPNGESGVLSRHDLLGCMFFPSAELSRIGIMARVQHCFVHATRHPMQGRRSKRWNGSRCEPSRRAERRAGAGWSACSFQSGRPLCAGLFGRSATKPTTPVSLAFSVLMCLPCHRMFEPPAMSEKRAISRRSGTLHLIQKL
jgi:hypothetical protein